MNFSSFFYNDIKYCLSGIAFSFICVDLLYPFLKDFLDNLTLTTADDANVDAGDNIDDDVYASSNSDSSTNVDTNTESDDDKVDDDFKMVVVVQKKSSKFVLQKCVNATIVSCSISKKIKRNIFIRWLSYYGQKKVFLAVKNKNELQDIYAAAETREILATKWTNEDDNQAFLVIGPDNSKNIDRITGHLKLF